MKICSVEGCEKGGKTIKGYCLWHYNQLITHGKILIRTRFDLNEIIIRGDIAEVVLYDRNCKNIAKAIINADDIIKIKNKKWGLKDGYAETKCGGKQIGMQYIVTGLRCAMGRLGWIDHKDGNPLNNRKENLRSCTHAENTRNSRKPKNNTSGYKGVSKSGHKWAAMINANCERVYLGVFNTKEKAAIAYNNAARYYHGEFARLNVINN